MNYSKISIITVVYNMADKIESTILSVLNQTYPNIEYIIIDGGSTDGTVDIIKKYEKRLAYWISEPDTGIYNAMNKGVIKATGVYCNFMNVGDKFYDNDVLNNVFSVNRHEDILHGITITDNGAITLPISPERLSLSFFYKTSLGHQATFINRELLKEYPYDESYRIVADAKFFIETLIINNKTYATLPFKICLYDTKGVSSNLENTDMELKLIFRDLFPPRIVKDYELMENYLNPLFRILYPITQSFLFQKYLFPISKKIKKIVG